MLEISLDTKSESFEISSYDGISDRKTNIPLDNFIKNASANPIWEFFREKSNHAYIRGGKFFYGGGCNNNLLISSSGSVRLTNVRNAFVFVGDSNIEISPIFYLQEIINKGAIILPTKKIKYNIPEEILKRENLSKKDPYKITEELKKRYGIKPEKVSLIPSRSKMGGIYYIEGKNGHKYVLKYRSKNREHSETLSAIIANIPDYFPRIFPRVDDLSYTFEMEDGSYGLEGFIDGSLKERNLDYFSLIGGYIATLHKQLSIFFQNNSGLERVLLREGYVNESSLASICIDLVTSSQKHNFLLPKLKEIINSGLSFKINSLPKSLIHNDLNHSNLIWMGEVPKIVDPDSVGIYAKINEFVSPLFLGGNRSRPVYVDGSLSRLVSSYNDSSENPLSDKEKDTLRVLLKYALLRYYVVRSIRRGMNEIGYLNETETALKSLDGGF